jgi:nicotinate-nucleotide adenylyltransferase
MDQPSPLALFGGTFNPVHYGHLHLAQTWCDTFLLAQVCFLPAGIPPHRPAPLVSPTQRIEMLHLALGHQRQFCIDTRDALKTTPCYSIETLRAIRNEVGQTRRIYWLMGMDSFLSLPKWEEWQSLLDLVHIVVAQRPNYSLASLLQQSRLQVEYNARWQADWRDLQGAAGGITGLQHSLSSLSSTQVRAEIASHPAQASRNLARLIPPNVLAYIYKHQIYLP